MTNEKRIGSMVLAVTVLFFHASVGLCERYDLGSPDGTVGVHIEVGERIDLSVLVDGETVTDVAGLALMMADGIVLGANAHSMGVDHNAVSQEVRPEIREKNAVIQDRYNELTLTFEGGFALAFRVYDNGIAYRFSTSLPGEVVVQSERALSVCGFGLAHLSEGEELPLRL